MSDGELAVLLRKRDILADLYSSWLEKSDSAYTEMAAHVEEEMKNIITGTGADLNLICTGDNSETVNIRFIDFRHDHRAQIGQHSRHVPAARPYAYFQKEVFHKALNL